MVHQAHNKSNRLLTGPRNSGQEPSQQLVNTQLLPCLLRETICLHNPALPSLMKSINEVIRWLGGHYTLFTLGVGRPSSSFLTASFWQHNVIWEAELISDKSIID